jgi:quercetin dioxygenase-like cupin family protein
MSQDDPTVTDPTLYRVIFENDRVRVLEYRDRPGDRTQAHRHPDSVMVTLSSFRRRVSAGERSAEVALSAGEARWLGAQEHRGENIGDTASHSIFIELKEPDPNFVPSRDVPLGPSSH